MGDALEIIISNNASTDDTVATLKVWQAQEPNLRIHHQAENIGAERNFYFLANQARGEFLWVFGDDDRIEPSAVEFILKRIKQHRSLDALVINFRVMSKDMAIVKRSAGLNFSNDQIFFDKNEVLSKLGLNLGYISSVIVRRDLFLRTTFEDYTKLADTGFSFAYAVYAGLHSLSQVQFIVNPLFDNRGGNSGGYNWYAYFVRGSSRVFKALVDENNYSPSAAWQANKGVLRQYVVHDLLARKRDGAMLPGLSKMLFEHYAKAPLFWLAVVPIFCVPTWAARFVWYVWSKLKWVRNKVGF